MSVVRGRHLSIVRTSGGYKTPPALLLCLCILIDPSRYLSKQQSHLDPSPLYSWSYGKVLNCSWLRPYYLIQHLITINQVHIRYNCYFWINSDLWTRLDYELSMNIGYLAPSMHLLQVSYPVVQISSSGIILIRGKWISLLQKRSKDRGMGVLLNRGWF